MTQDTTSSATWNAMTDEQKIEWLAESFLDQYCIEDGEVCEIWFDQPNGEPIEHHTPWNPLTDWNHWRQVEEKVMEDEELNDRFLRALRCFDYSGYGIAFKLQKVDLRTRCLALLSALDSLKNQ